MKLVSGMLCPCAAIIVACSVPAFAISDREHERCPARYSEYAEADRQLDEAWRVFKKVATPEHCRAMLREQRFRLKHRDATVAEVRTNDGVCARAAARGIIDRTKHINGSILAYDESHVTML